jgi:hypothetical protein
MDSGNRTRAVGDLGRAVISAGRRGEGRTRSRCPSASRFCASCRGICLAAYNPGAICGYGIRQLLQFADTVKIPRPAMLPVVPGQPQAPSDLMADLAAPTEGGASYG